MKKKWLSSLDYCYPLLAEEGIKGWCPILFQTKTARLLYITYRYRLAGFLDMELEFSLHDKGFLLRVARGAIETFLYDGNLPARPDKVPESLEAGRGAFVTLRKNDELRGCVGFVEPDGSLYDTVVSSAIGAAFRDNRFPAVSGNEIGIILIEISVLGPNISVDSWKEIVIGKHGFILEKPGFRALFLPEVAVERGWDVETALSRLSIKAGLGPDDWREGTTFEVFESIKFKED